MTPEACRRRPAEWLDARLCSWLPLENDRYTEYHPFAITCQIPTGTGQEHRALRETGVCQIIRIDDVCGTGLVCYGQKGYGGAGTFRGLEGDIAVDRYGRIQVVDTRAAKLVRFDDISCGRPTRA